MAPDDQPTVRRRWLRDQRLNIRGVIGLPVALFGIALLAQWLPITAADTPAAAQSSQPQANVLVVGDSIAVSLLSGLGPRLIADGYRVTPAAFDGCWVLRGEPRGRAVPGLNRAATDAIVKALLPSLRACREATAHLPSEILARDRPGVVLWLSVHEASDWVVDGRRYAIGSAAWHAKLLRLMEEKRRLFTSGGARLVLLTNPPFATPSAISETGRQSPSMLLNAVYRDFQRHHRGSVSIVDLARFVCPPTGTPTCPPIVGGIRPRPGGSHFGQEGAVYVAQWLGPLIERCWLAAHSAPATSCG